MGADPPPGKIATRSNSKSAQNAMSLVDQYKAKRDYLVKQVTHLLDQTTDIAVQGWSKGDVSERQKALESKVSQLDSLLMNAICDLDFDSQAEFQEDEELANKIMTAKASMANRLDALCVNQTNKTDMAPIEKKITVEVQQAEPSGSIPNIWGTFDGDYAQWNSFHDKWLASIHDNEKVKAVDKFQRLQAACIGAARNALGEWDLTEENYYKAWERLRSIYEDDYMTMQSFMRKLTELPQINNSSKSIRDTIDIVQKHMHGLNRYVDLGNDNPYVVFAVISRMDGNTFRAWEKHRPWLAKAQADRADEDTDSESRPGQYIPSWGDLEQFLETEVSIRVHAEQRNGGVAPSNNKPAPNKQRKRPERPSQNKKCGKANYPPCPLCNGAHAIYNCQSFLDMNIVSRLNHVSEHNLCVRCLRVSHSGDCANDRNNEQCAKCLPERKFHNSKLCPNANQTTRPAMKASDHRKRKASENKRPPNKRNRPNNRSKQSKGHSAVNKVGDWNLIAKQSNAIAGIRPQRYGKFEKTVLLATMKVRLHEQNSNKIVNCRTIADMGATLNCIAMRFIQINCLPTVKCQKRILGVSGPEIIRRKLIVTIKPWFESDYNIAVEFYVLKNLGGSYPEKRIEVEKDQLSQLILADPDFDKPAPIDALMGAEVYAEIIGTDLYKHKDGAIMQSTKLGHIILGRFFVKNRAENLGVFNISQINGIAATMLQNDNGIAAIPSQNEDEKLQSAIAKFWEIEEIDKNESIATLNTEQKLVEQIFAKTHYREQSGRYVVTIPIKENCFLGDSKRLARKQFEQLERKFRKNSEYKQKYIDYMRENISLGYMKLASEPIAGELCYWLPHHAVQKKFRIVLNASAKTTNGESLNSIQMVGGKLQYDAQLQTMRFRRGKHAAVTDITKMYNKVGLHPSQWNLHRLFWRESEDEPLQEYVMTVVIFGEASSPHNAVRAMQQNAMNYADQFPNAAEEILKSFYMDDGMFGCDDIDELKILCKEIEFVLNQGQFALKGWDSSSKEVEKYMNAATSNEITLGVKDETKILGLRWLKSTDELTIAVNLNEKVNCITKRTILSEIARLFDPNGFIAPIVVRSKMLMQKIWRLNDIGWDDKVPADIAKEWLDIYSELPLLEKFRTKRWLNTSKNSKTQIHGFCDASMGAYGASIYVRAENHGRISCTLLSAKSRVAPLKEMTIPRLELLAALLLSEQVTAVVEACDFQEAEVTLWSDSTIVLSWIKKSHSELKAFVANRVQRIQELTKCYKWKHVCSGDNPADLVSRGMKTTDFLKSKLWLHGPNWLLQPEKDWPKPKIIISPQEMNEITKECKPKMPSEKIFNIHSGTDNAVLYYRFQELHKILNITAYIRRMFRKAKDYDGCKPGRQITFKERLEAMEFWVKYEQNIAFKKEIQCIRAGESLPTKSDIASLRPILDKNGILRVGGRIDKANIAYAQRHQYIIPRKSRLSYLILNDAHEITFHGGAQTMLHYVRRRFWIPRSRFEIRNLIGTCTKCVKLAQDVTKQIMADLPEIRVRPAPPFQHVGVDMAGPYNMRVMDKINTNTRARSLPDMKGWVAVFVCLVTRAVHLEIVEGMSSDDFLNAYTRFTSRRGNPEKIYSDHGTNFVGSNSELNMALSSWKDDKVQRLVHVKGTEWKFIKPSAPHEGGIWEAAVEQMKHHLKRVIGTQKYSFQGMATLLAGIEACLNSRPICKMSDDPDDQEPLTPAHFLIGRPLRLPMPEKSDEPPYSLNRLYVQLQFQLQAFWKQWSEDYLQSLTQLPKWRNEQENVKVGQLVVIKADNLAPTYWAMGRILQVYPGEDGKVRSVLLKTQTGQLERSIRKICVLPSDIELSYWNRGVNS